VGDFLEWFGLNEVPALIDMYQSGQINEVDIVWEMVKAAPEKMLGSLRPEVAALTEGVMGVSMFPEPWRPRSVAKDEAIPNVFGLGEEYKWSKGLVLQDGSRPRAHYWQRWFFNVTDPHQAAVMSMYDARERFQKKQGKGDEGIFPISRYKVPRDAASKEDFDAFNEWKGKFVEQHGDEKAREMFRAFLRRMDPVPQNKDDAQVFEQEFLSNEQRKQLQVARQYTGEMRDLLVSWWSASDQQLKADIAKTLALKVAAPSSFSEARSAETRSALSDLRRMGIPQSLAIDAMTQELLNRGYKPSTVQDWQERLIMGWPSGD
jgi:hypothetical protein